MKIKIVVGTISFVVLLLVCSIIFLQSYNSKKSSENKNVIILEADIAYDPNNIPQMVDFSDYVFLGKIINVAGNDTNSKGTSPYTKYNVQVLENYKGSLVKNIVLKRHGGYDEDGNLVLLNEKKLTPIVNKIYLFMAMAQENGELLLLVSGEIEQNDSNVTKINMAKNSNIDAAKETINFEPTNRDRYVSSFDNSSNIKR